MNKDSVIAVLIGLGGLSLFLYGMVLMSEGLKAASGHRFRRWMRAIAGNRIKGFLLGLTMGTAVHSTATTVMAVGLINAGLLTLLGAIPLIAGANLGTTMSMQLIAFDISWLWAVIAITGISLRLLGSGTNRARVGQALLGISLLFLGMRLMSQSVFPFREVLSSWITQHNGSDWPAFMASFAASLFFTAILHSSGATIGILFALATAGIITEARQAFPFIIGAHVGTCFTAILCATGTSPDARRGAIAHLLFNVIAAVVSTALLPLVLRAAHFFPGISLNREIANIHTITMLAGCLITIPLLRPFHWLLARLTPFARGMQEQSYLDDDLLRDPELAIAAVRNELARITRMIQRSFVLNRQLLLKPERKLHHLVKQLEDDVDSIRWATRHYMMRLTRIIHDGRLAGRLQWLNLCLVFLERISDHNDNLADLSMDIQHRVRRSDLDYVRRTGESLYLSIEPILGNVLNAWANREDDGSRHATGIRSFRTEYLAKSEQFQSELIDKISRGEISAMAGFILTEYISEMDRIVRHSKKIAGILEKYTALVA